MKHAAIKERIVCSAAADSMEGAASDCVSTRLGVPSPDSKLHPHARVMQAYHRQPHKGQRQPERTSKVQT